MNGDHMEYEPAEVDVDQDQGELAVISIDDFYDLLMEQQEQM